MKPDQEASFCFRFYDLVAILSCALVPPFPFIPNTPSTQPDRPISVCDPMNHINEWVIFVCFFKMLESLTRSDPEKA